MRWRLILILVALALPAPLAAQAESGEIIVTGSRRIVDDEDKVPLIGVRRTADFAVQAVTVAGDTRDAGKRTDEIFAMIRGAIELAGRSGNIELATGETFVEPLTLANYRNLGLRNDGRPDTDAARFLIKTPLGSATDAKAALDRITSFIKAVPAVGRAEMKRSGDLTLSVVRPGQYRGDILDRVAADARATAARLGPDYAVNASGLETRGRMVTRQPDRSVPVRALTAT